MEKMRMIVLCDLPIESRHQRKVAREFHEWLFEDGFTELQEGVFTSMTDGRESAQVHLKRLRAHRPEQGIVRVIVITERQFQRSEIIVGHDGTQESKVSSQLDIFL